MSEKRDDMTRGDYDVKITLGPMQLGEKMIEENKGGGPAFPFHEPGHKIQGQEYGARTAHGMTLRDYFAAKAMILLLPKTGRDRFQWTAQKAYEVADAMLLERAK